MSSSAGGRDRRSDTGHIRDRRSRSRSNSPHQRPSHRSGDRSRSRDRYPHQSRESDYYQPMYREESWYGREYGGDHPRGPPPPGFRDGPGFQYDRGFPMDQRGQMPPPDRFHDDMYPPDRYGPRTAANPRGGRRNDETIGLSLLVRNIPADISSDEIRQAFSRIGQVRDVYIPRDYHSNQPKGFAFVEFANHEEAREARDEMDKFMMKGKMLEVVFAQERRKTPNEMKGRGGAGNPRDGQGGREQEDNRGYSSRRG